jgi:UDP-glucose 4-epimerase
VIHLAALISVEESFEKPGLYFDVNLEGTLRIVEKMTELGVKKIIFSSTAAVYGNPVQLPITEEHPLNPMSPYASSKLCSEFAIRNLFENSGIQYVILRFFNVYGPGQDPANPYSGVITRFAYNLLTDKPLVIYGDGRQTRDFVYIKDVVESVRLSLEKRVSGIFNVGTGKETCVIELAKTLSRIIGKSPNIVYSRPRRGDVRRSVADISKATRILGYQPKYSLENGLKEYIDYLQKNTGITLV